MIVKPVLVRPRHDGNVGAVLRAAANFGVPAVVIVDPQCQLEGGELRRMSMGAERLVALESAATLEHAVAGADAVVATTSGRERDPRHLMTPDEVAERLRAGNVAAVAVLFGGERGGLTQAELHRSHMLMTIPANPEFPTLNLVQAVAITLAALLRRDQESPRSSDPHDQPAPASEFDQAFAHLESALLATGFLERQNPARVARHIRHLLGRAVPTHRETAIVHGLAAHLEWLWRRRPHDHAEERSDEHRPERGEGPRRA